MTKIITIIVIVIAVLCAGCSSNTTVTPAVDTSKMLQVSKNSWVDREQETLFVTKEWDFTTLELQTELEQLRKEVETPEYFNAVKGTMTDEEYKQYTERRSQQAGILFYVDGDTLTSRIPVRHIVSIETGKTIR